MASAPSPRAEHFRPLPVDVNMQRTLITIGIILVVLGLLWPLLQKSGLGRLPGDIAVEKENFKFFFPITTSIIISIILSLILWFFTRK
jgi:ribose/xylose/arabinose/galactoside ABC-type transport system permease subunit